MVLHAFTMLASARGLCLARRLYTSLIFGLMAGGGGEEEEEGGEGGGEKQK